MVENESEAKYIVTSVLSLFILLSDECQLHIIFECLSTMMLSSEVGERLRDAFLFAVGGVAASRGLAGLSKRIRH